MMKWKVVKNPRSSSADRSLECLKNDVQQSQNNVNNNNNNGTKSNNSNNTNNNNNNSDTNNNVGEDNKQDNNAPQIKETNRQRESSLSRKPSIVATECINLKSILGLTRQRSETNLSNLGLISTEPRRSRSEVRGVSCDRLTVGYHTAPGIPLENGKTRSSSPPSRSGWLRGRKREREFRSPVKNSPQDVFGKTVVTGSNRKRTNSKSRTIVDGSDGKQKNKVCSARSSLEPRKCKNGRKSSEEDIIEEEIYTEINNEKCGKLLDENRDVVLKDPNKVIRKKGMAPKPQVATALFKDTTTTNGDVNLNPNVRKSTNSLNDASLPPPNHKLSRKNHQTYNGRNQDKRPENRMMQTVKLNNLKNAEKSLAKAKNNVNAQSVVAVAEIHKEMTSSVGLNNNSQNNKNKSIVPELESIKMSDVVKLDKIGPNKESTGDQNGHEMDEEQLPFHIDTPDYSTLDSVNCNSFSMSTEDITFSKDDATFSKDDNIANCCNNNTDCDESLHESTPPLTSSESCCGKVNRDISLSSILRDSSNDNKESTEPTKKTVRFEKLDLIEKYKKSKTENNSMEVEEEDHADTTISENKFLIKKVLDVNSNEISSADQQTTATTTTEELSQCPFEKPTVDPPRMKSNNCTNSMTVNVLVRNPSPAPQDGPQNAEDSPPQFVVKKSFVLTVAKQEKGFRSLCANKKPEVTIPEVTSKVDQPQQQISVTFLCSGPPSEGWVLPSVEDHQRLRSTSVPPRSLQSQPVEVVRDLPAIRGRSRDRRSRERQHCRKSHKAKKKEAVFAMPQAVIDELSQVLEKRKPSLDEIMVHP